MIRIDCRDLASHLKALENSIFAAILDESPDWIYIKDNDSRFVYSNKAHLKHLGLRAEQIIGLNDLELYPSKLSSIYYADETRLFENRVPIVKVEPNHENGHDMLVITVKQVVGDLRGDNLGLMGISRRLAAGDETTLAEARDHLIDMLRHDVGPDVTPSQMRALELQLGEYFGNGVAR
ncbi:MAG: PAS domain-containing protein [Verrucomicrobiota bacterium]